ncbi:MAG: ATP-binding protein [Pyrinomonadaceae bacterium]
MLNQLTGNHRVKELLRRMLESRRVPGALLFSGEEGVGKKLFALELAKAINCRSPAGVEACGECAACVRTSKINFPASDNSDDLKKIFWTDHPDVGLVQPPTRVFHVVQMRAIEREANYRPFEGVARFFLIDEADKLNDASANALLKTLEEPPPTSHIILITSRPAVLLPTIRSRCQAIRFAPLRPEEIEEHLTQNKLATGAEVRLRARSAAGSIGRAVAGDVQIYKDQREAMLSVLNALALTGDRTQLLQASAGLNEASHKDEYEASLDLLQTLIRDAWMLSLGVRKEQLVNEDILPQLTKVAARIDSQRVTRWISEIEELREQLAVNINRKVATDALFLSMASA